MSLVRSALTLAVVLVLGHARAGEVPVVVAPQAAAIERAAAAELAAYLGRLYPEEHFAVAAELPPSGRAVLVGSVANEPRLKELLADKPTQPESYVVATAREGQLGVVAGADPRGVVYGVYALLDRLGCGFYLSYDALPAPRREPLRFDDWKLADRPLVADRLVFNWHNFLSGCSTWNLADWKAWTLQSQKQGYNAVMVHAYGNNPMVSFTFNGKTKPVGYLSTTAKGRDWSTMHVNDVRRLWGGQVFSSPVFGSDAAMVPDDERAAAAQRLMQQVFAYAAERSMGVFFADDVDTLSANPQELILTLPPSARFTTGGKSGSVWLADPDTPEGDRYYRAQVESLVKAYPQITCLVVWFRNGGTPWMDVKLAQMPAAWQAEYQAAITKTPEAARYWHSVNMFAIGKIVRAFDRALKASGHERVQVAAGTWNFEFLPGADRFMPPHVKLIGLDYGILHDKSQLGTSERRAMLAAVGGHRPVVPVIWAQHDDGNYIGRPYTPFEKFHWRLVDAKAAGFGIIHWTTRPLDLHFVSHAKQVWQRTVDQPLRTTCDEMAERSFGPAAGMGEYLERWVTGAPKFARETGERFIDRKLADVDDVIAGCRHRLKTIVAAAHTQLTPDQGDRLAYYEGLEWFIVRIYESQAAFEKADALAKSGKLGDARAVLAGYHPEQVVEEFAVLRSLGGMTRGEQGLVVSMNTRWLPHYVRLRQALGLEPVRYHFGPTSHDPLAQAAGRFTFFVDNQHHFWQTLGTKETGAATFELPMAEDDLCRSGIETETPLKLSLQPILHAAPLPPGRYTLRLWMVDPTSTAAGQRVFDVSIGGTASLDNYAFDEVRAGYLRLECHGNSENLWNSIEEVELATLAKDAKEPRVKASAAKDGFAAEYAIDGKPETRWAALGENHWIEFRLDPHAVTSRIGIAWYQGDRRKAKFDVLVSDDRQHWTKVANLHAAGASAGGPDHVDVFKAVGQAGRALVRSYPVTLATGGEVQITLTPVVGKAVLSAAELQPVQGP